MSSEVPINILLKMTSGRLICAPYAFNYFKNLPPVSETPRITALKWKPKFRNPFLNDLGKSFFLTLKI